MSLAPYFTYEKEGVVIPVSTEKDVIRWTAYVRTMKNGMTENEALDSIFEDRHRSEVARTVKVMVIRKSLPAYKPMPHSLSAHLKPYSDNGLKWAA